MALRTRDRRATHHHLLWPAAAAIAAALWATTPALAQPQPSDDQPNGLTPDAFFVQAGRAPDTVALALGLVWDWDRIGELGKHALVTAYGEFVLGQWRADEVSGHAIITQIGFTPVLRLWAAGAPSRWFVEGGIGINALTPVYRTRKKRFSTTFNFGDHLAIGYRQPRPDGWEWSLRLQHFSNAGIDQPNPGENFVQLRLLIPIAAD